MPLEAPWGGQLRDGWDWILFEDLRGVAFLLFRKVLGPEPHRFLCRSQLC